jgi:hypothetical protein
MAPYGSWRRDDLSYIALPGTHYNATFSREHDLAWFAEGGAAPSRKTDRFHAQGHRDKRELASFIYDDLQESLFLIPDAAHDERKLNVRGA